MFSWPVSDTAGNSDLASSLVYTFPEAKGIFLQPPQRLPMTYTSGPQPFWHQGPVLWKTIFPTTMWGMVFGWFKSITFTVHILLHELHLRSSGIRSWRLGTPVLEDKSTFLFTALWPPGLTSASPVTLVPTFHTLQVMFYTPQIVFQRDANSSFSLVCPASPAKSCSDITSSRKDSLVINPLPTPASL